MSTLNYEQMTREALKAYMLEHRNDNAAFETYMDKLHQETVFVEGTDADLATPEAFASFIDRAKAIKAAKQAS